MYVMHDVPVSISWHMAKFSSVLKYIQTFLDSNFISNFITSGSKISEKVLKTKYIHEVKINNKEFTLGSVFFLF